MRWILVFLAFVCTFQPIAVSAASTSAPTAAPQGSGVDVSADQSLEYYQDKNLYVARGKAKAIRGDMTVTADILTAHERDKPEGGAAVKTPKDPAAKKSSDGDIDRMTAEGNVVILKPKARIIGQHAVYDLDRHIAVVTGDNLRYETDTQYVTARDSLEYWEDQKLAVARGNAVGVRKDRRVEGDTLTAEFRDDDKGNSQLSKMTALGHVVVITRTDISRGDKAVYDAARDLAIITGNVKITRPDGTQLAGDVGEVDFTTNQSRLLNDGSGRVRALLPPKSTQNQSKSGTKANVLSGSAAQ